MNSVEAFLRSQLAPSLPGPLNNLPTPARVAIGLTPLGLPSKLGALLEADQGASRALTGAGLVATALANRAHLLSTTRSNQDQLSALLDTYAQAQGNPVQRAQAVNDQGARMMPTGGAGLLNAVTDPLNAVGPTGKLAEAAGLAKLADTLGLVNRAQNAPFEAAGGALRALAGRAAPDVTGALAQAARDIGAPAHGPEFQLPLPGTQAKPPSPPVAIPARPVAGVVRQLALGEQVAPVAQAPAALPAHPDILRNAIAALEANAAPAEASATGLAHLGAATDRRPLSIVPDAGRLDLAGTPYASAPAPSTALTPPGTGPGTLYPGEGVTPELLQRFAKLRQFPSPSEIDINAEIGALRDPVTMMQDAYGQDWQNRLAALTGGKWGQPGSGARMVNGRAMLGDLDLTTALRDYLEQRGTPEGEQAKAALKALLPEQGATAATATAPADTLGAMRDLIVGGDQGKMGGYAPSNADFYAKRLGIPAGDVPGMLDQLVQEGTLGRLPDGSLGIKPAPTPATDRAAWQAKYVGQSQAGTDILAAGDKVGGSDLTQSDLNALSPQERMAALRKLAGGDIAAGGGGFGIAPARIVGTLAGATAGGALGAGIGAATDGDNRLRGAAKGAALGALVGGNVGAVAPSFSDTADAALRIAANDLKLANTDNAGNLKLVAGNSAGDILKQMNPFSGAAQRAEKKTFPGAIPRNALGTAANLLMNDHASGVPLMVQNVKAGLAQLPKVATDLEAAGRDPMAIAAAYEQMRSPTLKALAGGDALREREILAAGGEPYHLQDLGQMGVPALTGAVKFGAAGLASPRGLLLAPVTVATGVARGVAAPAIGSMHRLGVGVVENGGRDAVVELATAAKLQEAVPQILAAAQARGINPATLGPRIGEGILAGRTADNVFNQFYDKVFADASKAGGVEARATLGNYDQKTGLSAGVMKVAGVLFPGIDWNVQQAKILARGAAKHPLIAKDIAQLAAAPNPDDPAHRGQIGVGGPVGALLSGQEGGQFFVNPAYPFSPVGGDVLNLPRTLDPALHPGMLPYDMVSKVAGAFGAGINPAIQIAAYETGNTDTPPTSADRLLPAEQAADTALMRAVPGYNRAVFANPVAIALENAHAAETGGQPLDRGDIQTRIQQGHYVDPAVQQAAAALVLQQTGMPISYLANQHYLADLGNPDSALYRQAEAHLLGGQALGALANFVAPASGTAQTGTEARRTAIESALQNPQDPFTQSIIAQLGLPAGTAIPINQAQLQAYAATHGEAAAARMQLAMDLIDRANPALKVNVGTTDKERQALLQQQWEFQHQTGLRQAPQYMQAQEAAYLQRAGLLPPGALAGLQRGQDLRTRIQAPLVPLGQQGTLGR